MTKLLFCQECNDIVPPYRVNNSPRWCYCARHAVWWENKITGVLRLWDAVEGPEMIITHHSYPRVPRAYVIGITNLLFTEKRQALNNAVVEEIIDAHDDSYLFKQWRSMIIRIRPGESHDTGWAALPILPQ